MKLKFTIDNESDLPEDDTLKGLYEKVGEHWVLQVDGAVPKKQLDEFRTNNIELKKKLEDFGELTPEDVQKLRDDLESASKGNKTKEQIDAEIEKRVADMKKAHEKELQGATSRAEELQRDLEAHVIDGALIDAGGEYGLLSSAHEDLRHRGRRTFKLDENRRPVAVDEKGEVIYDATGAPMTPKGYVADLVKKAPHLFEGNKGSGAGGSGTGKSGSGNSGANPWKKESFNLTEQSRMFKDDPDRARQMASAAGVKL